MKLNKYNLVRYIHIFLDFIIIVTFLTIDEDNLNYLDYIMDHLNKYKYT
jgi:hypothetical protein